MKAILNIETLNKYERELHWVARILIMIYIGIIFLFAFYMPADSAGFWAHIIASIVVFITLIISWNHELEGIAIFTGFALLSIAVFDTYRSLFSLFTITVPLFVIAILFVVDFHAKKKHIKEMKEFRKAEKKNAKIEKRLNNIK